MNEKLFSKNWFNDLDAKLRSAGLDSDDKSFDEIKEILSTRKVLSPDEFASAVAYVILAGGFSQKTAKKIHRIIMDILPTNPTPQDLLQIFNNKNKINAIVKIWDNRNTFCNEYYKINELSEKLAYLETLPHIGKITANHLARNLGENLVKYDIWIQRLGVLYSGNPDLYKKIDNAKLNPEIKQVCDDMFDHLIQETGLPRGYIDVVLFKACQNNLIDVKQGA